MALLKALCWALIFIIRIRFPPGTSLATVLNILLFDLQCLPFSVSFLQKGETIVRISSSTEIECGDEL